jgi:hypothetical protein
MEDTCEERVGNSSQRQAGLKQIAWLGRVGEATGVSRSRLERSLRVTLVTSECWSAQLQWASGEPEHDQIACEPSSELSVSVERVQQGLARDL